MLHWFTQFCTLTHNSLPVVMAIFLLFLSNKAEGGERLKIPYILPVQSFKTIIHWFYYWTWRSNYISSNRTPDIMITASNFGHENGTIPTVGYLRYIDPVIPVNIKYFYPVNKMKFVNHLLALTFNYFLKIEIKISSASILPQICTSILITLCLLDFRLLISSECIFCC